MIGEISDGGRTITLSIPSALDGIPVSGTFQKAISSSEAKYTHPENTFTYKSYRFTGEDLMEAVLENGPPLKIKLIR